MKKILETLSINLTLITIAVLFLAYLYIVKFYSGFGIDITKYISASDIIQLSSKELILIALTLTINSVVFILSWNEFSRNIIDYNNKKIITLKLSKQWGLKVYGLLLFIIFGCDFFLNNIVFNNIGTLGFKFLSLSILLYFFIVFPIVMLLHLSYDIKKIVFKNTFYLGIIASLIFYVFATATLKKLTYLNEKNENKIELMLNNKEIIANSDSLRFISNTKDFYFFINNDFNKTTIIPCSQIEKITITNRKTTRIGIFE